MRVADLVAWLADHAQPNDVVFVNHKPAQIAMQGVGYVAITDFTIERREETVILNGMVYMVIR